MAGGLQFLAERDERITITGRGRVDRNFEGCRDLFIGEFIPDFQDQHFSLDARETFQRRLNLVAPVSVRTRGGFKSVFTLLQATLGFFFASRAAGLPTGMIERRPANGSDEQSLGITRQMPLMTPIANERFLNDILGIGERAGPLAGT